MRGSSLVRVLLRAFHETLESVELSVEPSSDLIELLSVPIKRLIESLLPLLLGGPEQAGDHVAQLGTNLQHMLLHLGLNCVVGRHTRNFDGLAVPESKIRASVLKAPRACT